MSVNVGEIVQRLERQVEQRRREGQYPFGLEAQLEAEFDSILKAMRRREMSTVALNQRVVELRDAVGRVTGTAAASSRVPGGAAIHGVAGRLVGRHTNQLAETVSIIGHEAVSVLGEVVRLFDAQRSADERQLNEVVAAVLDRIAIIDQLVASTGQIERRLAALEEAAAATS